MEFETGEEVIWKGRPAYHVRYLILTFLFFIGIFVIDLGPIGQAVGVTSFFLLILFLILSVVSVFVDKGKKYFLTNRRVLSHKTSLLVSDLSNVRMEQSKLGRLRGAGNVYFDSKDGRWIVFKHVKDPGQIVQSGLRLSGGSTSPMITLGSLYCNYCGARVSAGSVKCPNCGADM